MKSGKECLLPCGFMAESQVGLGTGCEDRLKWVFFADLLLISFITLCALPFLNVNLIYISLKNGNKNSAHFIQLLKELN